jgi:hypothetical protein
MQLLPAYYTTTNNRKRKAKRKTKSQLEAERIHEKFLAKYCGKSGGVNDTPPKKYQSPIRADLTEGSIPSLSNTIPVGVTPKKEIHEHNFTIAPAYNKGAYQVISKKDIKDIGR